MWGCGTCRVLASSPLSSPGHSALALYMSLPLWFLTPSGLLLDRCTCCVLSITPGSWCFGASRLLVVVVTSPSANARAQKCPGYSSFRQYLPIVRYSESPIQERVVISPVTTTTSGDFVGSPLYLTTRGRLLRCRLRGRPTAVPHGLVFVTLVKLCARFTDPATTKYGVGTEA